MRLSRTKITEVVTAFTIAGVLALTVAPAANAADAVAPDTTTQVVVKTEVKPSSVDTSVATTVAPVTQKTEVPIVVATTAPKVEAPIVTPVKTTVPADQTTLPAAVAKVSAETLPAPPALKKSDTETSKKVFVCKYVGIPNVDERLQTGQNPISVSVSAIQHNQWDGTVPGYFSDAHDRSYVLAYNTGQTKPDVSTCPAPVVPPVKTCVKKPSYSYTFDSATGSGDVTATGGKAGATLCAPLAVRAVAYTYDLPASGSPSWPQTQVGFNDTTVDKVGTFHYGPPQIATCSQYDVHASFDGYGALTVPEHLLGSHDPYEPAFLSETLKGKGPNPTYSMTTSEGCNPPPPTPKVCTTIATGPVATNKDEAGWNHHDTRSTGAYGYVNGGIRLQTTDTANPGSSQNKVTLYRSITPTPLSEFGEPSVTFADGGTGVKPGMQVGVDVNGDGTWDGYLVGEPWSYGAHNWWVNKPGFNVPSQFGYTSGGSWADFVAANPKAKVIELGLSMGSGVIGDWTVTNLTAGCTSYTFNHITPVVYVTPVGPNYTESSACGVPGTYGIKGASDDGDLSTETDPKTGTVTVNSTYSSDQGGYNVVDTTTKDGVHTITFAFVQIGEASIKPPGADDAYVLKVENGVTFAYWTHTFDAVAVCPTVITTPPVLVVAAPTCSADGSLPTLAVAENYKAAYGRVFDGPGTYSVVLTANDGFVFSTGKTVSYDLTVKGKTGNCPTTPPTTPPTPPVTPPTHPVTPASNGGANTGFNGSQPGASTSFWSPLTGGIFGVGMLLGVITLLGAFMVVRKRNRYNGETGAENL